MPEAELKKPFEHKGKIEEITKELSEINAELDLNKREEVVMDTGGRKRRGGGDYMALPEMEPEKAEPAKRPHKRMTEKLYKLYADNKAKEPDAVIFLKNGDYYETVGRMQIPRQPPITRKPTKKYSAGRNAPWRY